MSSQKRTNYAPESSSAVVYAVSLKCTHDAFQEGADFRPYLGHNETIAPQYKYRQVYSSRFHRGSKAHTHIPLQSPPDVSDEYSGSATFSGGVLQVDGNKILKIVGYHTHDLRTQPARALRKPANGRVFPASLARIEPRSGTDDHLSACVRFILIER